MCLWVVFVGGLSPNAPPSDPRPKRILVTGGAGFIGFHLSKTLAANPENFVIAMDNFNDYYDVKLKIVSFCRLNTLVSVDLINVGFKYSKYFG